MIASYVEQRIGAGESRESAWTPRRRSREQLFPGGKPAEGQHVMNLVVDGEAVGVLWMGRPLGGSEDTWYVFYVEIDEAHRGRGSGARRCRRPRTGRSPTAGSGSRSTSSGRTRSRSSLYDSLGYQVMATAMFKDL